MAYLSEKGLSGYNEVRAVRVAETPDATDDSEPIRSDVPALLISGSLDGRTPPANAAAIAETSTATPEHASATDHTISVSIHARRRKATPAARK